jgi:hypothetical protein
VTTDNKSFDAITFGEIMLRLSPPDRERMMVSESFDKHVGGSELNVSSGISLLGLRTGIISKTARKRDRHFRQESYTLLRRQRRLSYLRYPSATRGSGIYYYENGALSPQALPSCTTVNFPPSIPSIFPKIPAARLFGMHAGLPHERHHSRSQQSDAHARPP